jgi:hypothetical protein
MHVKRILVLFMLATVECPAFFEPVSMRETVIQGANDGTTDEAYG